jgi:hypothetical protein
MLSRHELRHELRCGREHSTCQTGRREGPRRHRYCGDVPLIRVLAGADLVTGKPVYLREMVRGTGEAVRWTRRSRKDGARSTPFVTSRGDR